MGDGFQQLIELQRSSMEYLQSIRNVLGESLLTQRVQALEELAIAKETDKQEDETREIQRTLHESLAVQKQLLKAQTEAAIAVSSTIKTFKTFGEGFQEFKASMRANFGTVSRALLSTRIVKSGSMVDRLLGVTKRASRDEYVDRQRMLGSTKTKSELREDFKEAAKTTKAIQKNEAEIETFKRKTGLNEEQMAKSEGGKALLDRRSDLGAKSAQHDLASQIARDSIKDSRSQNISEEDQQEAVKRQEEQTDVLKQIAENTKPSDTLKIKPESEGGAAGGKWAVAAGGISLIGEALAKLGKGIGQGLAGILQGVARGFAFFFNPATLVGMGAFALAALGIGKALEMAAPAIAAFAPVLVKVADVIQNVLVEGIKAIPGVITAVGDTILKVVQGISDAITGIIDTVVSSIERLAAIDGSNLLQVGAGLLSIGAGLAAFGAGTAVAGVGNLVGGLLNAVSGQKSPIEQLEKIASLGPGLSQAGMGIEKLSAGLRGFSSTDGSTVSNMSSQVGAMKEKAAVASTNVVAPSVTNNVKQTQMAKIEAPVRTNESSLDRYFSSRLAY
jgi:hypothetical protein